MFECSDSMSYYGQETTCMVPIVIGKCDNSYFSEFGYSFFVVGAKPHSYSSLINIHRVSQKVFVYKKVDLYSGLYEYSLEILISSVFLPISVFERLPAPYSKLTKYF